VLLHTSHAGNVGAVARAMKVMGFDDLVLVAPRWPDVLERTEAIERASGAGDVLARARVVDTLDQALDGIDHVCATAMTPRDFGPPVLAPRTHFAQLLAPQAARPQAVALVFGSERFGMRNEDVYRCHACLSIPTSPTYGSLNIAAAVQLIAYDWREALGAYPVQAVTAQTQPADAVQVSDMLRRGCSNSSTGPAPASRTSTSCAASPGRCRQTGAPIGARRASLQRRRCAARLAPLCFLVCALILPASSSVTRRPVRAGRC
jgi:tRNA/rRNA methyltransferase